MCAKNALGNNNGYSSNQMVFGRNINLPSILTDSFPALEPTQSSEVVRMNLEAMHVARQNFIKTESSERIRRALRHKVRSFSDNHYENSEKVFYERVGFKEWRGSSTVIGGEEKIVLVRHGTAYYRCHPCHLMKVMCRGVESDDKVSSEAKTPSTKSVGNGVIGASSEACVELDSNDNDCDNEVAEELVRTSSNKTDGVVETEANEETDVTSSLDEVNQDVAETEGDELQPKLVNVRPKRNTHVEYAVDGNSVQAKVLSVQPKRNGKNGNWLNVHVSGVKTLPLVSTGMMSWNGER